MERSTFSEHLKRIGEEILQEAERGQKPLLDIFRDRIVPKINYGPQKKADTFTPPQAFEIAMSTLNRDYHQSEINFGIFVIYKTLDLNPDNAVERLRPFLSGPLTRQFLRDGLIGASLAIPEDYLGFKRDVLFNAFTDREWLNSGN